MTTRNGPLPLIPIGNNFWNLRGSFVMFHVIDIGTHMSFICLPSGKFLVIDTCDVQPNSREKAAIDELTDNGRLIEAVLGTHPFHTMFFKPFHKMYPNAKYYGTPRHLKKVDIPWAGNILDEQVMNMWADQGVTMSVPDGTDIVTPAEDNHLSCVFVFHHPSRTIHIDDTIMYFENPTCMLRCLGRHQGDMDFWAGGLKKGLKATPEAPIEFKNYIQKIINEWDFDTICTAHVGNIIGGAKALLQKTLDKASPMLDHLAQSRQSAST